MATGERELEKLKLVLDKGRLRVVNCREAKSLCSSLLKSGFMSEDHYVDALEALYQTALENAVYEGRDGWRAVVELLKILDIELSLFLVYYDLRKKGRRVKTSPYPRSDLVLEGSSGRIAELLVLEAGERVKLRDIAEWARLVQASSHVPVVAIVDELGAITYYEVSALTTLV